MPLVGSALENLDKSASRPSSRHAPRRCSRYWLSGQQRCARLLFTALCQRLSGQADVQRHTDRDGSSCPVLDMAPRLKLLATLAGCLPTLS